MQLDFHYYATYCAAYLTGFSHEECLTLAYSANFVDHCSKTLLTSVGASAAAATTQLPLEMMDAPTDLIGLQDITRIWASFHFLPRDLNARPEGRCSKRYLHKYRMICGPNGALAGDTVRLAKGAGPEAAGVAMHVLADTWAHQWFAGTPSLVINNTDRWFYELLPGGDGASEREIVFRHTPNGEDDPERGVYVSSIYRFSENSIMNLGHGRAGHLPDYSFIRYRYLPAWDGYREHIKDNPSDYEHAFRQMVFALRYLRGEVEEFTTDTYDTELVDGYAEAIRAILRKRQTDARADWKRFAEQLSGREIPDFDPERCRAEYLCAPPEKKDDTLLGRFILAALAQKSMVTGKIYRTGNRCAGVSVDYAKKGFRGMRDFRALVREEARK